MDRRHSAIILFIGLSLFLLLPVIAVPEAQGIIDGQTGATLDTFLERTAAFGFSGAVLVSRDGQILLSKGYGLANRKENTPVHPQTAFAVASITKPFTAAAILKLEQYRKLKISDTIGQYFHSVPADKVEITVHQLLTHTSGLDDLYAATGITDRSKAVQEILKPKLIAKPGERYSYSNDGYGLLAAIIEIASNKTYPDFVREELLEPAGMIHTGFWGEKGIWPKNSVAHSYNMLTDNGSPEALEDAWGDRGSGDMITSVEDLYRWDQALRQKKILPVDLLQKMYTPRVEVSEGWYYGYGWSVITTPRGSKELYHGGGDIPRGFTAEFHRYLDENITTIVLVNSMMDEVGLHRAVGDCIKTILFGGDCSFPPPLRTGDFDLTRYVGSYQFPDDSTVSIVSERGQLVAYASGQQAIGLLTGYKPELKNDLEKLNQRIEAALTSARKNSFSDELSAEQWRTFLEQHGAFQGFQILGTAPIYKDIISTTYARLNFAKGTEVYRWVWRKGKVINLLSGSQYPVIAPLVPILPGKFVTYHLLLKTGAQIDFEQTPTPVVTLKSDYGTATARPIQVQQDRNKKN